MGAAMVGRAVDPLIPVFWQKMQKTNQGSEKKRNLPIKPWKREKPHQNELIKRFT